jgi:fructose-1,6-bisphosphatase/inositol monophosphatase family enzyme
VWDVAAGSLIAKEAGAALSSLNGGDFDIYGTSMVCAGNEQVLRKIMGCCARL